MPRKTVVQSQAVVSSKVDAVPAKVTRKKSTSVKAAAADAVTAPVVEKKTTTRKKVAVAADTTNVAAVTHRHKKQETTIYRAESVEVVAFEPSHDEVAQLAYSYYVARGYQPGDQSADWFRAVEELKQRHAAAFLTDLK